MPKITRAESYEAEAQAASSKQPGKMVLTEDPSASVNVKTAGVASAAKASLKRKADAVPEETDPSDSIQAIKDKGIVSGRIKGKGKGKGKGKSKGKGKGAKR